MFVEDSNEYMGKRFHLTKIYEESETERLYSLLRKIYPPGDDANIGPKYLVIFKVDKEFPLIGPGIN